MFFGEPNGIEYESEDHYKRTNHGENIHIFAVYWLKKVYIKQFAENAAVDNTFESLVKIYPNPVQNLLYIKFADTTVCSIELTSIDGKVIIQKSVENRDRVINMSNFPKGIYFIQVKLLSSLHSFINIASMEKYC